MNEKIAKICLPHVEKKIATREKKSPSRSMKKMMFNKVLNNAGELRTKNEDELFRYED